MAGIRFAISLDRIKIWVLIISIILLHDCKLEIRLSGLDQILDFISLLSNILNDFFVQSLNPLLIATLGSRVKRMSKLRVKMRLIFIFFAELDRASVLQSIIS